MAAVVSVGLGLPPERKAAVSAARATVIYDGFDHPVNTAEVRTVLRLQRSGVLDGGLEVITPRRLAQLVRCEHRGGREPCPNCLGAD